MQLRQQLLSAVPAFLSALKDGNIDGFNASLAALLDTLAAAEAAGSLSPEDRSIGGIVSKFIEEFATRMIKIEEADEKARASMRAEVDAALDQTTFCPGTACFLLSSLCQVLRLTYSPTRFYLQTRKMPLHLPQLPVPPPSSALILSPPPRSPPSRASP